MSEVRGIEWRRVFTVPTPGPGGNKTFDGIQRSPRIALIRAPDGSDVFRQENIEAPVFWSDLAIAIASQKYFIRTGVPGKADGREDSVFDMVLGVAGSISGSGHSQGYFTGEGSAARFEQELKHVLIHQLAAFNSPVWFNVRHWTQHGIEGSPGNWAWDESDNTYKVITNGYARPQCSACFILGIKDTLVGDGGLMDVWKDEARLFKGGSGSGLNFSRIREKDARLSSGGRSSGLMSFLPVGDKSAGSMKSGGIARRAAKMVCLDADHPEIFEFVNWKRTEEKKAKALVAAGFSDGMEGEAYTTVSGQNSNNSVRVSDDFMERLGADQSWDLTSRMNGRVIKTVKAKKLWEEIAFAAWECADPGLQFDTTINNWNTTPNAGRINASNPCSEYMHLDDSACNLSSIRLTRFLKDDISYDVDSYLAAAHTMVVAQDILVDYSSYPTEAIAKGAHRYRQLGLGYADLGALLMRLGVGYASEAGLAIAGSLTSLMTAQAYLTSTELAEKIGPFEGYEADKEGVWRVIGMHAQANHCAYADVLIELAKSPSSKALSLARVLFERARAIWAQASERARLYGVRNAQLTVLAPTGTIGFLMDCTTTGVEPLMGLVQFKTLIGGGRLKLVSDDIPKALRALGYAEDAIDRMVTYVVGHQKILGGPCIGLLSNIQQVLPETWTKVNNVLAGAFDLREAFTPEVWGVTACERLGVPASVLAEKPDYNLLTDYWKLTSEEIDQMSDYAIGRGTLEGSEIKPEHLEVFDTAFISGKGTRFLRAEDHVEMMSRVQPFLSGAISKTVNLPDTATVEDIARIHELAWRKGLKSIAVYRDGSKGVQAVITKKEDSPSDKLMTAANDLLGAATDLNSKVTGDSLDRAISLMGTLATPPAPAPVPPIQGPYVGRQRKLPNMRDGKTWGLVLDGHKIYLRSGEYEDGTLGEIFITLAKEGSTLGGLVGTWATTTSLALQYGVPLAELVEKFIHTRFEPFGMVQKHASIKLATSIVDLVMRTLAVHYLGRTDLQHVKEEAMDTAVMPEGEGPYVAPETVPAVPKATVTSAASTKPKISPEGPACLSCGNLTYRNGSCYRCHNCGSTTGCS